MRSFPFHVVHSAPFCNNIQRKPVTHGEEICGRVRCAITDRNWIENATWIQERVFWLDGKRVKHEWPCPSNCLNNLPLSPGSGILHNEDIKHWHVYMNGNPLGPSHVIVSRLKLFYRCWEVPYTYVYIYMYIYMYIYIYIFIHTYKHIYIIENKPFRLSLNIWRQTIKIVWHQDYQSRSCLKQMHCLPLQLPLSKGIGHFKCHPMNSLQEGLLPTPFLHLR